MSREKILYVYFQKLCFVASTVTTSLWLLDMLSEIAGELKSIRVHVMYKDTSDYHIVLYHSKNKMLHLLPAHLSDRANQRINKHFLSDNSYVT